MSENVFEWDTENDKDTYANRQKQKRKELRDFASVRYSLTFYHPCRVRRRITKGRERQSKKHKKREGKNRNTERKDGRWVCRERRERQLQEARKERRTMRQEGNGEEKKKAKRSGEGKQNEE